MIFLLVFYKVGGGLHKDKYQPSNASLGMTLAKNPMWLMALNDGINSCAVYFKLISNFENVKCRFLRNLNTLHNIFQ